MKLEKESLNEVYKEFADIVGYENMEKIFSHFKGQVVSFPTRIYSKEYVLRVLSDEYNGKNSKQLARKLGYSERWILKLISTTKNEIDD